MTINSRNLRKIENYIMRRLPQVKLSAFTLAEVLITLVIIGVVSVLVLPTVINKVQGYANKRAHMVFQSKFKTGIQLMTGSNALAGYQTTEQFVEQFRKYIKIAKVCDNQHLTECFPGSITDNAGNVIETQNALTLRNLYGLHLGGSIDTNVVGLILQDGTNILLAYNTNCVQPQNGSVDLSCISMVYDTNGGGKPNRLGLSAESISSSLGQNEDNSNIANFKDVGKINANQYGVMFKFDGTAESCNILNGTIYGSKCQIVPPSAKVTLHPTWYTAILGCPEGTVLPDRSTLAAYFGGVAGSHVTVAAEQLPKIQALIVESESYGRDTSTQRPYVDVWSASEFNADEAYLVCIRSWSGSLVSAASEYHHLKTNPTGYPHTFICLGDIVD